MTWRLVPNRDRRFGSARHYWWVVGPRGRHLLLTSAEVERAAVRAGANPEDLHPASARPAPPRVPWWRRLWRGWLR
ncbi:MAG: hypothetical protein AB1578_12030 [Thermodesulfobacteriota bacterium]